MPLFSPQTTIYLIADSGIDESNKPYFESNSAIASWLMGKAKTSFTQYSYQRADERQYCIVDYDYYSALECDAIMWQNAGHSTMWIIANITAIEWLNPNATKIYFEVDPYCTFCGEIQWQACMVEREHVTGDWKGNIPNWENHGVAESVDFEPVRVANETTVFAEPNAYVVISPYNATGDISFQGTIKDGIFQGLTETIFQGPDAQDQLNAMLQIIATADQANLQNIIGIFSVPGQAIDGTVEETTTTPPWLMDAYGIFNNAKVFNSQYCVCQLDSMNAQSVTYRPELFGIIETTVKFKTEFYLAGGTGGFICYPASYGGGTRDVKEWGLICNSFPAGSWVGNNYAQWQATSGANAAVQGIAGVIGAGVAGVATYASAGLAAGLLVALSGGISSIVGYNSTVAKAKKGSAVVGGTSGAGPNLSAASGDYGVVIRWMTPRIGELKSLDNYFDKYGYRVNLLKVPNVNTRPLWNYVKTNEAHVGGDIPKFYRTEIEKLLNNGVTFWHVGSVEIGDYSNPAGNKE